MHHAETERVGLVRLEPVKFPAEMVVARSRRGNVLFELLLRAKKFVGNIVPVVGQRQSLWACFLQVPEDGCLVLGQWLRLDFGRGVG